MSDVQAAPVRRWAGYAGFAAVVALHLALLLYYAPPRVMFSARPVLTADHSLHVYQVQRAREAYRGWGALWSYDPGQLAGQPAGVEEDLTSKGTELFVIALSHFGVALGFAFNLFIVIVQLLVPFVGYASARLFDLDRRQSTIVSLLWVLLWFFDSFMHWCWWVGMYTWSLSCVLAVLLVGLLYRALESDRRIWFLPLLLVAAVLTLNHPFAVFPLVVPSLALYVRAFKKLDWTRHALLWLCALGAASTVLVWIRPTWHFREYILDVDTFFRPRLEYALFDTFDLLKDARNTGAPVRTLVRMLAFVAGGIVLWRWRRKGDHRVLPIASMAVWCLGIAYVSSYWYWARQTQPYRQIGPAMLVAALPASVLFSELLSRRTLHELGRPARLLLVLCLVAIVPRAVRTVLYFIPDALPKLKINTASDLFASSLVGIQEPKPNKKGYAPPPKEFDHVRRWLMTHAKGRGRIVVADWPLGEYLAASTKLPILGGIEERNVPHVDAQLFRIKPDGNLPGKRLEAYFRRYAVGYLVMSGEFVPLDFRRDALSPFKVVDGFRIYRTRIHPDYFLRGKGHILSQSLNRIDVDHAEGKDVVLRFHWMDTLRCRPGCKVERFAVAHDRVGFIRIPHPPSRFEVYNSYSY